MFSNKIEIVGPKAPQSSEFGRMKDGRSAGRSNGSLASWTGVFGSVVVRNRFKRIHLCSPNGAECIHSIHQMEGKKAREREGNKEREEGSGEGKVSAEHIWAWELPNLGERGKGEEREKGGSEKGGFWLGTSGWESLNLGERGKGGEREKERRGEGRLGTSGRGVARTGRERQGGGEREGFRQDTSGHGVTESGGERERESEEEEGQGGLLVGIRFAEFGREREGRGAKEGYLAGNRGNQRCNSNNQSGITTRAATGRGRLSVGEREAGLCGNAGMDSH